MSLNPVYFGASSHQLFGMYEPSVTGGGHGAVLCAPWGQEYIRAHQSLRHVARLLARAGVHAFRFDYFGTGDSAGEDLDGSLRRWVADTVGAIEELKDTAGIRTVSLVGLRLGATVAAMAAHGRTDVRRLALWDPVFDGAAYLDEVAPGIGGRAFPGEVSGFRVAAQEYQEIRSVSLRAFDGPLPPSLIVSTQSARACQPLADHLRARSVVVSSQFHEGPCAWLEVENFGAAGLPVAALHAISRWVAA